MFSKTLLAATAAIAMIAGGVAAAQNARTSLEVPETATLEQARSLVVTAVGSAGTTTNEVALQTRIQFKLNSAQLTATAQDQLRLLSQAFNDPSAISAKFLVEGHTDATGSAEYNKTLSQRRAASVMAFLANNGVDKSRLTSTGYGEERLIPDTDPNSPLNRRVEFLIQR